MLRIINTVFVMTGYECNLSCKYCMQSDVRNSKPLKMSNIPLVADYLEAIAARQEESFNVHFYGGEPLLYLDEIKQLVERLKRVSNINFSMVSNGTLITDEVLRYLNENDFGVCVSWDGRNVLETRGVDVLKENPNILKLDLLQISAVLSSKAYFSDILQELTKYQAQYKQAHDRYINFNIDLIQQHGSMDESLLDLDLARIDREMKYMIQEYDKSMKGQEHEIFAARLIGMWISTAQHSVWRMFRNTEYSRSMVRCHNGYTTLNMDLSGRLYQCHNDEDSFVGTVEDSYDYILENVMSQDNTKENCKVCKNCPAVYICNCGCIKIDQDARASGYCDLRKAVYAPILDYMLSLGDDALTVKTDHPEMAKSFMDDNYVSAKAAALSSNAVSAD